MSIISRNNDSALLQEGRKRTLGETAEGLNGDEVQVKVPLREQVAKKLMNTLKERNEGLKTRELWTLGNSERQAWLTKMQAMLESFDEFVEPIYDSTNNWSSTLHLPTTFIACKTYHARFLAALVGIDPPFTVKARQAHNVDRAHLIQELMSYALKDWANHYKGVERELDQWLWRWVTQGSGILKARWDRRFVRFVDVIEEPRVVDTQVVDGQVQPVIEMEEVEKEVLQETFNGPVLEAIPIEDVLLIGGRGDPQAADDVIQCVYMTASELLTLSDQRVFDKNAVEKIIDSGRNYKQQDQINMIKTQMAASSGTGQIDKEVDVPRYMILERYARIDVDGSGIASDIIVWSHFDTGEILRATYLHRVNKAGLRPYFKIDFHLREGQDYGTGLPELIYSLQREIDALHNMRMDFGLISSLPFGFYRATSSMKEERMPLEPGIMIPLDNPQADVFFPNIQSKTGFLAQEEQMLYATVERLTSISDLSLGIVGGQGAARTATGARALLGESNANLDVFIRRLNRGWRDAIQYLFKLLQDRLPENFQFRLLGDNGSDFWKTVRTKAEIAGEFDFALEANSANSNKAIQIEQANSTLMTIMNPLLLQMGIVSPLNIYEALKTKFKTEGVSDFSRYITKPAGEIAYTPLEIANATLSGVNIRLGPTQDLQGFVQFVQEIIDNDELLGYFNEQQAVKLAAKQQEAIQMIQALEAQAAQQANAQQMSMNASMASAPTPQGAGAAGAVGTNGGA